MEENKEIKIKKLFRNIYKTITVTFISLLVIISLLFLFFIVHTTVSNKRGTYPKVGLYTIISPSMEPKIKQFDIVLVIKSKRLKVGDVITYYSKESFYKNTPITHRIVSINEDGSYIVKGDANENNDNENIYSENIIGKVVLRIPGAGKIQFFLASKNGWFIAIIIPAVIIIIYDIYKLVKFVIYKKKLKKIENKHGNI